MEPSAPHEAPAAPRLHPVARAIGERLVPVPAGAFLMGGADVDANPLDAEGPVRSITVPGFRIDPFLVTNEEFAAFVDDTGYVTVAEEFEWSFVFAGHLDERTRESSPLPPYTPWWRAVLGARWDQPEGPGSTVADRARHPVVHMALRDADAFARWCGLRLPTEAEWEKAARGGLEQARYAWGNDLHPGGAHMCNIFQGEFPTHNTCADGFAATSPVGAYPPNGFGLFDVAGNVWEWCRDAWDVSAGEGSARVIRGGSFLCHDSYCNRYRVAARTSSGADDTSSNKGMRLAMTDSGPVSTVAP
ncbi:MAG: formylglycine-generating enzyme family protein [Dermabacter sp.]|nr:formylglycine-generating enzyme family protein [Dermabacter sp.]